MKDFDAHASIAVFSKTIVATGAVAFVGALLVGQMAFAQEASIDGYCTRLGEKDHVASDGVKLTDASAIIRQDRANYHAFKLRDEGDEADKSFASKADRARLETMVKSAKIDAEVKDLIVKDTPFICVTVYPKSVDVWIASQYPFLGAWTCGGTKLNLTRQVYNDGTKDITLQEVQEGSDGSYTLMLTDEVFITVSDFSKTTMNWYSSATDKKLACTKT